MQKREIRSSKPILQSISGVWLSHIEPLHENITYVPYNHNLQLVTKGSYLLRINHQEYSIKTGDLIYYYYQEKVHWVKNDTPVEFYSIVFQASAKALLPLEQRVCPSIIEHENLFDNMEIQFSNTQLYSGNFSLFSSLNHILNYICQYHQNHSSEFKLWAEIEKMIIQKNNYRPKMEQLIQWSGYSQATIQRSCYKTHQTSPWQRIRQLRMEKAKILLEYTNLPLKEISEHLSYPRVHEFSREFKSYYKINPSQFKKKNSAKTNQNIDSRNH